MIKIAVCDDDRNFISDTLKLLISKAIKEADVQANVTYFYDGNELLEEFKENHLFDVVILDIDMPSINGKELARKLRDIDSEFCLAFISAFKEEVFSTIPLGISAFIPKEFDKSVYIESITKILKDYSSKKPDSNIIEILVDGIASMRRIPLNNIYYIQSINGNNILHTYSEQFVLVERVLDKIAQEYVSKGFYRTHRNFLVNIEKIFEVKDREIVMSNNDILPLSKRNRKPLLIEMTGKAAERVMQ